MERTDHAVQLSLDTAWRPLHDAYTALTAAYGIQFVMESIEPGCGIFFNTDDDGIAFSDRYCVTGDTSVVTPSGLVLWEKLEYGDTFSSENVLLQHFRDLGNTDQDIGRTGGIYPLVHQSLPIISQKGYIPMQIYVLHGYTDGLTDPIVSTDYEEVYAAMKAAYENALDGVEQEDSDREYSFLEGWSATAVVHGDWMEWQIAELELKVPEEQPTPSV